MDFVPNEDVRTVVDRSGRVAHLLERQAVNEQAEKVFEQIRPEEPPKPPVSDDHGEGDRRPEPQEFSLAAVAVALAFIAGGCYLLVIGVRGVRHELAHLKGGKQ